MKKLFSMLLALCMLCAGVCFAEFDASYVYIQPAADYDVTEGGYILRGEASFEWFADGNVYGYTYVVQDIHGFDVAGYTEPAMTDANSLTLYADDFEKNRSYTLTVYAHVNEYDAYPISAIEWFMFVEDASAEAEGGSVNTSAGDDRRTVYMNHYDAHLAGGRPVLLADVTGDRLDEMIILNIPGDFVAATVLTVNANGEVVVIYDNFMPMSHGGICGLYLIPQPDGGYALLEECDELWQGIGKLYFTEFRLTETGEKVYLRNLWLSSDEPGCVDANGMIAEFLIDDYARQLGDIISTGNSLFVYSSMSSAFVPAADMSYDGAFLGYAEASASVNIIASEGLISMMGMEYMEIYFALSDMTWYDSVDYPGIWFLNGIYAGGNVTFEYYTQPDEPGAYPYCMRVTDLYGDRYLPVTRELLTGMTWAQVQQLYWESLGEIEQYDGYAVAYGYPEQGCMMTLMFDEASENGKLVSVTVQYFE